VAAPSPIDTLRAFLSRAAQLAQEIELKVGTVASWQDGVTASLEAIYGSGAQELTAFPHLSRASRIANPREEIQKRAERLRRIVEAPTESSGKVFIGHGRSQLWRELQIFLSDTLHLPCVEFNSRPAAGYSTKERLEMMLDEAGFAFLVMTGEDEDRHGKLHARENVIHEAGLFQGRLGFSRAIILLDESCSEFSNINGLIQIRFPTGNISAKFEDVREVLERERVSPIEAREQLR
jgi:predicted nucleotide-binding protein